MGYADGIRVKYTAKWGVQVAGMNLGTHSSVCPLCCGIQKVDSPLGLFKLTAY